MIPEPGAALTDLAMRLATRVAPETSTPYAMADAGLISQLLLTLGQEFERSIATRIDDLYEMKTIFKSLDGNHPMAADCATFIAKGPESLHLKDVNALHDEGTRLLIALHAWAEDNSDAALNLAIWNYLAAHMQRHRFEMG